MHKLRSVYEALDSGQNQQALKQCNQILKKKPDMPLVKALKALSLVRTGSVQEGVALCRSVQNASPPPTDESILNAMLLVYKQTGNMDEMCKCYEVAWQVDPKNEDLAAGVFFSYVRVSNFAKQQQIALKIFKQFPKDGYYMWAVVSTYLQGLLNNNPALVPLAEKMMDKVVTENKVKTSEVLLFYISMLSQAGKHEKVIELLSGPLGVTLLNDAIPGERIHMQASLLTKLKKIEEANKLYYDRITEDPDDWAAYTGHLDSLFELQKGNLKNTNTKFDESRAYFKSFQQSPKLIRGPFLAEIELESRLFALGEQKASVIEELLVKYFEKFGAKGCCVYDLRPYLKHVAKEGRRSFVDRLRALVPAPSTPAAIQQSVTVHQLTRMLGLHQTLSKEEKLSLIRALVVEYNAATAVGTPREPSERIVGDDLILLAVHILEDLYSQDKDIERLTEAAALLEWARTVSKSNFQFLLHLVDINKKLQAFRTVAAVWPLLAIRYIQLDTLLHMVFDEAIQLGFHQQFTPVLEQFLKFHDHSGGTPDSIVQTYSHHSYSKIKEFLDLKSRLERSHQLAIVKTEQIFITLHTSDLSLQHATTILKGVQPHSFAWDDQFFSNLSSNQDPNALDRWDPIEQERPPYPRDKKLAELKQRRLVLAMLTFAVLEDSPQFQTAFSAFSAVSEPQTTSTADFDSMLKRNALSLFGAHSAYISANAQESEEEGFQDKVHALQSSLQDTLDHIKSTKSIANYYRFAVELMGWVTLIVQGWVEHQKKKAKKDKKEWVKTTLEPFITTVTEQTTTLAALAIDTYPKTQDHVAVFAVDTPKELLAMMDTTQQEINASHKQSLTTLHAIILTRSKILSTLRL